MRIPLLAIFAPLFAAQEPADYFQAFEHFADKPEARHVALLLIAGRPDTRDHLGKTEKALRADLVRVLSEDLKAVAWADLACVPGEAAVIAAGLKHAARFKQVSLPALWAIAHAEGVEKRAGVHALRVLREIYGGSQDKEGLRRRLADAGEVALAARLDEWKE